MPMYKVDVEVSTIIYLEIEADSKEEALEEAKIAWRFEHRAWNEAMQNVDVESVRISKDV